MVLAISLSFAQTTFAQTTIVIARVSDFVLIGADSKLSYGESSIPSETFCKIGQSEDVFFAIAGTLKNDAIGWSVKESAIRASKTEGSLLDKVAAFERQVIPPLTQTLEMVKKDRPSFYEKKYNSGDKVALSIVFVRFEKGIPVILIREFQSLSPTSINIIRTACPGNCNEKVQFYYLGQSDAIKHFVDKNPPSLTPHNIASFVNKLVEVEIEDRPNEVGPPIDILRVEKDSARWIQKKNECPDILPQPNKKINKLNIHKIR